MDTMTRARIQLIEAQPFYGAVLQGCLFSWNPAVQTAAVGVDKSGRVRLIVAPQYFDALSEEHRVGLLMHEILHLRLNHITRGEGLDQKLANIAMDIALNQYLPKECLNDNWLTPETYSLERGHSYEYYYLALLNQPKLAQKAQNGETTDNHSGIGQFVEGAGAAQDGSQAAGAFGGTSESLSRELEKAAINELFEAAQKAVGRGNVPMEFEKILADYEGKKSAQKWKSLLKNYLGRALSNDSESTRTRPNRRMGFSAMGTRRNEAPVVMIGVDNSGSMGEDDINQVMNEAKNILKGLSDKTEVVYFDVKIAHIEKLSKITQVKRYASGGTSFDCVLNHANNRRPDVLVMLTDGDGYMNVKPNYPIIWVLPKGSRQINHAGAKVYL